MTNLIFHRVFVKKPEKATTNAFLVKFAVSCSKYIIVAVLETFFKTDSDKRRENMKLFKLAFFGATLAQRNNKSPR